MDYAKKNRRISNGYYNLGLEKAKKRDLCGAVYCLKKSLQFYKYHTQSRNLLGLVYYEIGEVADALLQWVISTNLQPGNNAAVRYMDKIRSESGYLEIMGNAVKRFNQALIHARNGSEDLAILQLKKVVEEHPNYVKAHLVLAILLILHSDYGKAQKSLNQVLKIDRYNPRALSYQSILKGNLSRNGAEGREHDEQSTSFRQDRDSDVIIPSTYRESTGWQSIINIIVGLILGAAVIYFLVMPANTKAVNQAHNQEMLSYYEKLNGKNAEVEQLKTTVDHLQEQYDASAHEVRTIEDQNGYLLKQYQVLAQMLEHYRNDRFNQVVLLYTDWDPAVITDEVTAGMISQIHQDVSANGYQILEALGNQARDRGEKEAALDYYQKSLSIKPDHLQVIYEMAVIYKSLGQIDQANELFGQLILNYPNSELAAKAKEQRGY